MADKILVLDDEEHYAEMLQAVLEEHYFVTDVESDPEKALRSLERQGYKLVISDYRMPVMDGADFLVQARQIDPDLPIILVSGLMNTPELLKVANLGVTLVYEKPVHLETFLESVRRFAAPLSASEFYRFRRGRNGGTNPPHRMAHKEPEAKAPQFPSPLHHVSAEAEPMKAFLTGFWHALTEQSHVFVQTPAGSEIELLMREAVHWQHREDRSLHFLFAHRHRGGVPHWLQQLPSSTTFGHTVGVLGYQLASAEQQELLVDCMREAPEEVVFVHFINSNLLELASNRIHPELLDLLRENLSILPPLQRRLSDLVVYVQRYLPLIARKEGLQEHERLAEDAFEVLLGYAWPHNFGELIDVLRRAVLMSDDKGITSATLLAALQRFDHEVSPAGLSGLNLESWLRGRQKSLLRGRLPAFGNDLSEVLRAAGAPADVLSAPPPLDELPLLYPELLESVSMA